MVKTELPGRRKRGRPQRRSIDVVKQDIQTAGVTEEDAQRWDGVGRRQMICCDDPLLGADSTV